MPSTYVKIAVFVPQENADDIRQALGKAGAGSRLGSNYSDCTFSTIGTGRFRPEAGANPHIGCVGEIAEVAEERIETICVRTLLPEVLAAMKAAHPYEEVAYDVWALEDV